MSEAQGHPLMRNEGRRGTVRHSWGGKSPTLLRTLRSRLERTTVANVRRQGSESHTTFVLRIDAEWLRGCPLFSSSCGALICDNGGRLSSFFHANVLAPA